MVNKENIVSVEKKYHEIDNSFVCYSVTHQNNFIVDVPHNETNTDYQAIQEWAAIEGNNIIDPGA
tara:strand:- start:1958 stop:2152 length:195 start_codon:yes stop_codon:yes gene_type:complete